jgi:hypothetical protein
MAMDVNVAKTGIACAAPIGAVMAVNGWEADRLYV